MLLFFVIASLNVAAHVTFGPLQYVMDVERRFAHDDENMIFSIFTFDMSDWFLRISQKTQVFHIQTGATKSNPGVESPAVVLCGLAHSHGIGTKLTHAASGASVALDSGAQCQPSGQCE